MEIDQSDDESSRNSDALRNLSANGPLITSMAKLSASSRNIPSQQDFHYYNNFPEFKRPIQEIDEKSKTLLAKIGESEELFAKAIAFPDDKDVELDDDVALDYMVTTNDEIYEGVDESLDEYKALRRKDEESGARKMSDGGEEDGFQVVYGKKNKKLLGGLERNVEVGVKGVQEVKVATKLKPKVPFHIPTIPKPQDEYKINVNNSNQPFEHVWLQRSEDGTRFIHPLENLSVLDFVDTSDSIDEPVKPPALDVTPFKFVEEVKDLKQLANKLRSVDEFAVDLEHNQYRSFQGMTCLMQISTRTEDFVIDTLKLRIHIGPYLREVFKDPTKRKVMHGANSDIFWLQRDFGIYVCNMFDTGQASRVLKLERFSLEYLLNHFCGVTANKEYQNADWRIRPLPREMIKYAREDTHYLLYIYDLMRTRLLMSSAESEDADPPLIQVYKRSYDICTQLYEKELLTDSSYLYIYGVQGTELNAQQLAIVSGLCEWRDVVARAEDESTGYVLPNRTLIEIAKQMPLTESQLRRVLKSKHPFIDRSRSSVVSVIRHSIQNAAAFEETAKYLKERRLEILMQTNEDNALTTEESEVLPSEAPELLKTAENGDNIRSSALPNDLIIDKSLAPHSAEATVQTVKKPSRGFGALFGNSAKRKFDPEKREQKDTKLEQIKSSVSLPFHTFSGKDKQLQSDVEKSAKMLEDSQPADIPAPATGSSLADIINLEDDSDVDESAKDEIEEGDEPMSLSDLSSSFQKILPSQDQNINSKEVEESQQSEGLLQVQPFDYEAARKEVKFGGEKREESDGNIRIRQNKGDRKKGSVIGQDEGSDFAQGRRRQAFPASGNRSATFR